VPANKKHHYVPRFYLKNFASDGRSVSLYNFRQARLVREANLKNQCFRDYMYGKDGQQEHQLSQLEGGLAPLLRWILESEQLPEPFSPDHEALCILALLQYARTAYSADALDDLADGFWRHILAKDPRVTADMLEKVRIANTDPANLAVSIMLRNYHLIMDMKFRLLVAHPAGEFVTSDNPVVFYNQLLEFERFGASTGLVHKGLQIVFPLSPRHALIFYDSGVYRFDPPQSVALHIPTLSDMQEINALQDVAALENVYFDSAKADIFKVVERGRPFRRSQKTRMLVMPERKTPTGSSQLIGGGREDVRTNLVLTFVKLLKPAKKWRKERMRPGPKPAVVPRDARFVKEHESFQLLVEQGKYQPTEFIRYLRERR